MSKLQLNDQKARDKIINELNKNFLVEAGAGSGKTTSLVQRMVALVSSGKVKTSEIAAITFTRKAAGELKERFQSKLEEEYKSCSDIAIKENLKQGLNELHRVFIGTVHSFAARLLRERPVEAGIDPDFTEIEGVEEELLLNEAWEKYILKIKGKQGELLKNLEDCGISFLDLKEGFQTLNCYSELEIVTEKTVKPELKTALNQLLAFCQQAKEYIPKIEPEKGYDKTQKKIWSCLRKSNYLDLNLDINIIKILNNFNGTINITLNRWLDKNKAKEYRDETIVKLMEEYITAAVVSWREYCHYHIVRFLKGAVKYYQSLRQERSLLNFQDLLMITAKMLRDNPEIRKYFQSKYKCLLVDEFQDTDPLQAEIVFYLTGAEYSEKDWTALPIVAGSLFVVGDPKQSIYRFNRADIDIYNLVKEVLIANGGEVIKLNSNFRSLDAIAEFINPVMKTYLPENFNTYQAAYVPLNTVRENRKETEQGIRVLKIDNEYTKKKDVVEREAESIAKIIKDAVNGNMRLARNEAELNKGLTEISCYGDFLILLRYKDMMDTYAKALEKYEIPVSMTGASTLASHEIKELNKLLLFLSDIDNKVFLTAVLRGLFFGISDNQLYQYKNQQGVFNIYSKFPSEMSKEIKDIFNNPFNILKKYHKWSLTLPPATALEKIVIDLGLIPYASTKDLGKSRSGNIYYLLEYIKKAENKGINTFSAMVKELEILIDSIPEKELNLTLEDNTVRLMNLHKAKGLEAPVVFLAHPCKNVKFSPEFHIKRQGKQSKGYFSFVKKQNWTRETLAQPKNWDEQQREEELYQAAEEMRLLYVAATRAKNMLVISSCKKNNYNPWLPLLEHTTEEMLIDVPKLDVLPDNKVRKQISKEDFITKREGFNTWQNNLVNPTYKHLSPTEFKDEKELFSIERKKGGGRALGNVIHKVLEELVNNTLILDKELNIPIEKILQEYELSLSKKEEIEKVIVNFKKSKLWDRLKQAEQVYTEFPFIFKIETNDPLYEKIKYIKGKEKVLENNLPIIFSGVIDLVFKEKGSWVIVDYKTDQVAKRSELDKLREIYLQQVKLYSKVWERVTTEKVKENRIYFIN